MRRFQTIPWLLAGALLAATGCGDSGSNGQVDATTTTDGDATTTDGDATATNGDATTTDGDATTTDGDATATTEGDATTTTQPDTVVPTTGTRTVTLIDHQTVDLVAGRSTPIAFEVPEDVVSISVSVLGTTDATFSIDDWQGPGGLTLAPANWELSEPGICTSCPNRLASSEGAFAAIAPNNPAAEVAAGAWTFVATGSQVNPVQFIQGTCGDGICDVFEAIGRTQCGAGVDDCAPILVDGPVTVSVHAKLADDALPPETGVLDLALHFTGAKGWTAATAPTDPELQSILDSVRTLYGQVGITIGDLTYRDVDSSFAVIESVQGSDSDLMQLFAQSEGAPRGALSLFFVDEISAGQLGGFGVILGVAGGIPGPPLTQGSWRSGVAISVKEVDGAPAGIETTIGHEMGHFLGLFHTSEQAFGGPQLHDPLPDTPNNDESYLMFNTGAGSTISPFQGRVMRSNPWVRHPDTEDTQ